MASFAQSEPNPGAADVLMTAYGFVPNLFQAQCALPAVVEAQAGLVKSIILLGQGLGALEKKAMLAAVGAAHGNRYVSALHLADPPAEISPSVVRFVAKLACHSPCVSKHDIDSLRNAGLGDRQILEVVATTALGNMLCLVAQALNPPLDLEFKAETSPAITPD